MRRGRGQASAGLAALFIIVLLLAGGFGYLYLQTRGSLSDLNGKVSSLQNQVSSLQGNASSLSASLAAAEARIAALEGEERALIANATANRGQILQLQAEVASLMQTVQTLESELASFHPGLSLVSAQGTDGGTKDDLKHKVFQAAGRYWVFYQDSALDFGWQSSTDGVTWTQFTPVFREPAGVGDSANAIYDPSRDRVWVVAGQVYNSSSIDYRFGTPLANGSIAWGGPARQETARYVNPLPAATVDSGGVLWNTAVTNTSSNVLDVFRNGTMVSPIVADPVDRGVIGALVSAAGGQMLALVGPADWQVGPLQIFTTSDEGVTWQGPVNVNGTYLVDGSSAVFVGGELMVVAASSPGPTFFTYRPGDSTVGNLTRLDSLSSNLYVPLADAAMATDGNHSLFVVYTNGVGVFAKTSSDLGKSWGTRVTLQQATQLINVPFSISPVITNGTACVEWESADYWIWFEAFAVP